MKKRGAWLHAFYIEIFKKKPTLRRLHAAFAPSQTVSRRFEQVQTSALGDSSDCLLSLLDQLKSLLE